MAASAEDCIFCKIVRREAPASIVREDASTLAFMDILPMNTGHVLVIPKAHAEYIEDLPPGAAGPILEAAKEVSGALRASGIRCEAVSFYLANGKEAGQEVFHTHMHVIPRWRGDGLGLRVRADRGRVADRKDLDNLAAKIRAAMGRSRKRNLLRDFSNRICREDFPGGREQARVLLAEVVPEELYQEDPMAIEFLDGGP